MFLKIEKNLFITLLLMSMSYITYSQSKIGGGPKYTEGDLKRIQQQNEETYKNVKENAANMKIPEHLQEYVSVYGVNVPQSHYGPKIGNSSVSIKFQSNVKNKLQVFQVDSSVSSRRLIKLLPHIDSLGLDEENYKRVKEIYAILEVLPRSIYGSSQYLTDLLNELVEESDIFLTPVVMSNNFFGQNTRDRHYRNEIEAKILKGQEAYLNQLEKRIKVCSDNLDKSLLNDKSNKTVTVGLYKHLFNINIKVTNTYDDILKMETLVKDCEANKLRPTIFNESGDDCVTCGVQ